MVYVKDTENLTGGASSFSSWPQTSGRAERLENTPSDCMPLPKILVRVVDGAPVPWLGYAEPAMAITGCAPLDGAAVPSPDDPCCASAFPAVGCLTSLWYTSSLSSSSSLASASDSNASARAEEMAVEEVREWNEGGGEDGRVCSLVDT